MIENEEISWRKNLISSFGVNIGVTEYDRNTRVRLLASCDMPEGSMCWVSRNKTFTVSGKRIPILSAAYALFKAKINPGEDIVTTCGNASCCFVPHLTIHMKTANSPAITKAAANDDCEQ